MRIVFAEKHDLIREGIRLVLERGGLCVAAEARDGREAVRATLALRPDITMLAIDLPLLGGLGAAREIIRDCPTTRTVLLAPSDRQRDAREAAELGVRGFLLLSQTGSDLIRALRNIEAGECLFTPSGAAMVPASSRNRYSTGSRPLTGRQQQVLDLVANGKSTKEIALALGVSIKTVEAHRTRLMQVLQVHNSAELIRRAIRLGLLDP